MKKVLLTALLSTYLLTGCVIAVSDGEAQSHWSDGDLSSWEKHHKNNRELIANLAMKTRYQEVLTQLKTPDFSELLQKQGDVYQVLYYATQSIHSDSKTTKDECTPLVFKNDALVGIGDEAYQQVIEL